MAELDLDAGGAAIRELHLDAPPPISALRSRSRRRRNRRRASGAIVVVVVVALAVIGAVSDLHPGRSQVVTSSPTSPSSTSPSSTSPSFTRTAPPVRLPAVAHPKSWRPVDLGLLRVWILPKWQAVGDNPSCKSGSGDVVTLEPTPRQFCTLDPVSYVSIRTGVATVSPGEHPSSVHGVPIWTRRAHQLTTIVVPRLRVTITVKGTPARAVAATLGASAMAAATSMTGPVEVPASWKPVRFDGFQVDVPTAWKISSVYADCGDLFTRQATAYTGQPRFRVPCPLYGLTQLLRPGNGVWLRQTSRSTAGPSSSTLVYGGLRITVAAGTSSNDGWAGVPIAAVTVHADSRRLTVELGLGSSPLTAERILSSFRYPGSG